MKVGNPPSGTGDPPLIYDVGMHNGDDTHYYLTKGWRVVAIDANPEMCRAAERRFAAHIELGRLRVLEVGVGLEEGVSTFYINDFDPISSFAPACFRDEPEVNQRWTPISVQVRRLSSIFHEFGFPSHVKIDIEYSDELVLRDFHEMGILPSYLSVEVKDKATLSALLALNYERFKIVPGETVGSETDESLIRTLDGSCIPYRFPRYSSGPLADDLCGEWLTADEMTAKVEGSPSSWLDVHACRRGVEI